VHLNLTSGQNVLTKGSIAILSPLPTANKFVRIRPTLTPSNTCFWAHMNQPPNGISSLLAVFAGHIRMTNTQTQTGTQTDGPRYV